MYRLVALVVMGGACGIALRGLLPDAGACSCPTFVSEERHVVLSGLVQTSGTGDLAQAQAERWTGEWVLSDTSGMGSALRLWVREEVSDEVVRDVELWFGDSQDQRGLDDTAAGGGR